MVHVKEVKSSDSTIFDKGLNLDQVDEPVLKEWSSANSLTGFYDHYAEAYDTLDRFGGILPDRFGARLKKKLCLTRRVSDSTGTTPKVVLWEFEYTDSASIENVLRNWYLEFGNDRKVITPGSNDMVDSDALVTLISERKIYVLQHVCQTEAKSRLSVMKENFKRAFSSNAHTIFEVDCSGDLKWSKFRPRAVSLDEQGSK